MLVGVFMLLLFLVRFRDSLFCFFAFSLTCVCVRVCVRLRDGRYASIRGVSVAVEVVPGINRDCRSG